MSDVDALLARLATELEDRSAPGGSTDAGPGASSGEPSRD
jgi:hypothetical protein